VGTNVLKPRPIIDSVKALVELVGHWSDCMTIDPVYIKIFITKNYRRMLTSALRAMVKHLKQVNFHEKVVSSLLYQK